MKYPKLRFYSFSIFTSILLLPSCGNLSTNNSSQVLIEPGTEVIGTSGTEETLITNNVKSQPEKSQVKKVAKFEYIPEVTDVILQETAKEHILGYWVGEFKNADRNAETYTFVNTDYAYTTTNMINISIDEIIDSTIIGHSIVAGNSRPFKGYLTKNSNGITIHAKEPGNDKYDGEFMFTINTRTLSGIWTANNDIKINKREYELVKKYFVYDSNQNLNGAIYVNWNKKKKRTKTYDYGDGDIEKVTRTEFEMSTDKIYEINASNTLLTKEDVQNLKRSDITIIRNTIYARHGYSFRNKPLRVFFERQNWYIPIHTDIRTKLTDKEKANIKLLLRYEKNAVKYYESFGRG
jgi:hypothetical protein